MGAGEEIDLEIDLAERELTAALVEREDRAEQPFGCYLVPSDDPAAELGRRVEREVFLEVFGNSAELMAAEYDPYEPGSLFLVVVDHRRTLPVGVERFMMPSPCGLKTLHDLERVWGERVDDVLARSGLRFDPARVWDVSTIAVRPEYRGAATNGLISAASLQAVIQLGHACAVEYFVTVLDLVVMRLVQDLCHRPLHHFRGVEPLRYLDSPASVPLYIDMADYCARLAAESADDYATWIEGRGLEAAMSTPDWTQARALMPVPAAGPAPGPTPSAG